MTDIYLDLDGVVVDIHHGIYGLWGLPSETVDQVRQWDHLHKPLESAFKKDFTLQDVWDKIDEAGEEWWTNLPPTPWASGIVEAFQTFGEVTFMTSPAFHTSGDVLSGCLSGKVQWVKKNFPGVDWSIVPKKDKMAHRNALLIDDNEHWCQAFELRGGRSCVFPRPWNSRYGRDPMQEVLNSLVYECYC